MGYVYLLLQNRPIFDALYTLWSEFRTLELVSITRCQHL